MCRQAWCAASLRFIAGTCLQKSMHGCREEEGYTEYRGKGKKEITYRIGRRGRGSQIRKGDGDKKGGQMRGHEDKMEEY